MQKTGDESEVTPSGLDLFWIQNSGALYFILKPLSPHTDNTAWGMAHT